jgi:hypothetical protein
MRSLSLRPVALGILMLAAVLALAACSSVETASPDLPRGDPRFERERAQSSLFFGPDPLTLGGPREESGGGGMGIGVNAYLWRASLDTIDFMPLASADPFGGVIITDWYAPPGAGQERLKVNVFILDTALRADALKASVFRQTRAADGSWEDAPVEPGTARQLEDTILTRARELRIAAG